MIGNRPENTSWRESLKTNLILANTFGLVSASIFFCFNSKVDINGFLLMTSFVFFGLYQGIQSGAEDIYINNSIDKNLRKSTSLRIYLAESLGALFAAGFSYILVMYASPGQEQGSSTVVAWDSTMRIAYAIT